MKIEVFNHASIKLTSTKTIYFDPFKIDTEYNDATYIFITHDHYDHYDEESIKKVINENTVLIVPTCLYEKASTIGNKVLVVEPNKNYTLDDITFQTTFSYNNEKPFHQKEKGYVGYNVLLDGTYYYIMGDTDRTEEANQVTSDVCFIPIGGTYTMNEDEAADYINDIKPKKVIPIHYGSIVGDKDLGEKFKQLIDKKTEVEILI